MRRLWLIWPSRMILVSRNMSALYLISSHLVLLSHIYYALFYSCNLGSTLIIIFNRDITLGKFIMKHGFSAYPLLYFALDESESMRGVAIISLQEQRLLREILFRRNWTEMDCPSFYYSFLFLTILIWLYQLLICIRLMSPSIVIRSNLLYQLVACTRIFGYIILASLLEQAKYENGVQMFLFCLQGWRKSYQVYQGWCKHIKYRNVVTHLEGLHNCVGLPHCSRD